jgi:hypothetical protein
MQQIHSNEHPLRSARFYGETNKVSFQDELTGGLTFVD